MDVDLHPVPARRHARRRHRAAHLDVPVRRDQSRPPRRLSAGSARLGRPADHLRVAASTFSGSSRIRPSCRYRRSPPSPPQGFGLVQRSRDAERFSGFRQPVRAPAERLGRAQGRLGRRAAVELVEIPSGRESNDNIVAFWRPAQGLQCRAPRELRLPAHLAARSRRCPRAWARSSPPAPARASTASAAFSFSTSSARARRSTA